MGKLFTELPAAERVDDRMESAVDVSHGYDQSFDAEAVLINKMCMLSLNL